MITVNSNINLIEDILDIILNCGRNDPIRGFRLMIMNNIVIRPNEMYTVDSINTSYLYHNVTQYITPRNMDEFYNNVRINHAIPEKVSPNVMNVKLYSTISA